MGLILFWLMMAVIVAMIADSRGHSGFAWFFYGLLVWPIALVHVLLTPKTEAKARLDSAWNGERYPCPHCAELIRHEAKVCPFCRRDVEPPAPRPPRAPQPGVLSDDSGTGTPRTAAIAPEAPAARTDYYGPAWLWLVGLVVVSIGLLIAIIND